MIVDTTVPMKYATTACDRISFWSQTKLNYNKSVWINIFLQTIDHDDTLFLIWWHMLPVNWQYWRTLSGRRPSLCISPAIRFWPADIVHSPRLPLGVWISLPHICGNHFGFQTCRWVGLEPDTCKKKKRVIKDKNNLFSESKRSFFFSFFLGGGGCMVYWIYLHKRINVNHGYHATFFISLRITQLI